MPRIGPPTGSDLSIVERVDSTFKIEGGTVAAKAIQPNTIRIRDVKSPPQPFGYGRLLPR
jgi:hypothetical protein